MANEKKVVVGLGEILWDVFPSGPQFGGAPANFACSVAGLARQSVESYMVSGVGMDRLGRDALTRLRQHCVDTAYVSKVTQPTGQVQIDLDDNGNASYEFAADVAWDNLAWHGKLRQLALRADAVCFGTLGQRSKLSRDTIQQLVATTASDCLRIFDINLRLPHYDPGCLEKSLGLANVLKLNEDELGIVAEQLQLAGDTQDKPALLKTLAKKYGLLCVALTLGSEGSLLQRGQESSCLAAPETEVVDTVGAGDAFTAALALGLLANQPLDQINQHATRVAAYVCSQAGATPEFPAELRAVLRPS